MYFKQTQLISVMRFRFSLWPHMPREHTRAATPHVRALCDKWGIEYELKTTYQAFYDVFRKLADNPGASRPIDIWNQMMYKTS